MLTPVASFSNNTGHLASGRLAFASSSHSCREKPQTVTVLTPKPVTRGTVLFEWPLATQSALLAKQLSRWGETASSLKVSTQLRTLRDCLADPKREQRLMGLMLPSSSILPDAAKPSGKSALVGRLLGLAVIAPRTSTEGFEKAHHLSVIQTHPRYMASVPTREITGAGKALFYGLAQRLHRENPNGALTFVPMFIHPDNFYSRILAGVPYQQDARTSLVTMSLKDLAAKAATKKN